MAGGSLFKNPKIVYDNKNRDFLCSIGPVRDDGIRQAERMEVIFIGRGE